MSFLREFGKPVKLPAVGHFVATEHFVISKGGKVPISYIGKNFRRWLLPVVETGVPAMILRKRKLLEWSVDVPIITEIGGYEKAETPQAHIHAFLGNAYRYREEGYVFYAVTALGTVCVAFAAWRGVGWRLGEEDPVSEPHPWRPGRVIVAR